VRVLFWGTSSFAVPSLNALVGEGFDVVGVVTQPDRSSGRSRSTLKPPPIKEAALAEGLSVLQPERPSGAEFLAAVSDLAPDLSVVASYGHILAREVIDLPPMGTVNVHASLLPKLRGASPIQTAIREGHDRTGITIMRMVRALDAGPIILQAPTPIASDETGGELELRLSELATLALIEALTLLRLGMAIELPQSDAEATYAPKIEREMERVSWERPAVAVARQIRAYDPRPSAFTTLRGHEVKLFGAAEDNSVAGVSASPSPPSSSIGERGAVLAIDERGILVACGDGAVWIAEVQPAGKRQFAAVEWARGRGVRTGDLLGE